MKKIFTLAAVAALVLASCAKIETIERNVDEPIAFRPYSGTAITKAGTAGEMTTATLQTEGFGVFAYQNTGSYDGSVVPNFMYNTKVSTSSWTYSPIKYWPNQIQSGDTDRQTDPAQATKVDVVSFFAYAPHVAASALSGATSGITGLSANNATGDPKVTYTVSDDLDNQVDLLWGVVNPATDQTWQTVVSGKTISLAKGMPYKNLQKPAVNTAIHFYFRHALAQLTLTAVGAYNQVAEGGTAKDDVKITISKVELTVPGMTQTATLNLNNTTANQPLWESATGSANLALTVTGDNLNAALKDAGDVNASAQPTGVTASPTNVITNGKYYTVIPTGTSTTVNVKVTYYVTTDDTDLAAGHSRVENVISHDVVFSSGFAAGTKNTIKMILGISEVKFEAEVVDWAVGVNGEVNLPQNL
jgi:hypothetical protein